MPSLLIIDDEEAICSAFQRYFGRRGFEVALAHSAADGYRQLRERGADLAFVDVRLPDESGLNLLPRLREARPETALIVITAYGSMETVAQAVKANAFDYLPKPIDLDRAERLVEQALRPETGTLHPDVAEVRRYARQPSGPLGIVGRSPAMQEVFKTVVRTAQSDSSVLIRGCTGTGKELVAQALHHLSGRAVHPFVAVNGGALPLHLVEGELFGYEKGAFTGAVRAKPGRFEAAHGGSLFLDEVGELPHEVQVKLLRFLDQQVVERLGSMESKRVDVRVIAATNRDLADAVRNHRFREDLYYRLAIVEIELPPLAERREDILPLTGYFLGQLAAPDSPPDITPETAACLTAHSWPGNVRELRNALEHALVAGGTRTIQPDFLPPSIRGTTPSKESPEGTSNTALTAYADSIPLANGDALPRAAAELEAALIRRALRKSNGNQSTAAKLLGIHRNTLRQKIEQLSLDSRPEEAGDG